MDAEVVDRRAHHGLAARVHPEGGLTVRARGPGPEWTRVDTDLVALVRAVTRQFVARPADGARFAEAAERLAQVRACPSASPADRVVRASHPLLAGHDPWPPPALPGRLPAHLAEGLRSADPRAAARRLFGDRATRPVVRALCDLLVEDVDAPLDAFRIDLAAAASEVLPPEHLEHVLRARPPRACRRDPLDDGARRALPGLLDRLSTTRRLALLVAAAGGDEDRERLQAVLRHPTAAFRGRERTWQEASIRLLLGRTDLDATLPGATTASPPEPTTVQELPEPARVPWTLHEARTSRDLLRLSRQLSNCLDTYVGRLGPRDRVVEVRDIDGDPSFAVHLHDGRIRQFKGRQNRDPDGPQATEITELLVERGWTSEHEARRWARPRGPRATVPAPRRRPRHEPDDAPAPIRLARRLLGPEGPDRPDWSEVAAVLWLAGLLPTIPDPDLPSTEQAVLDLAALVVAGRADHLPSTPREPADIIGVRDELRTQATIRTTPGWRRRAMARVLDHVLADHGLEDLDVGVGR